MGNKSQGMCWEETRYALQFFGCELCIALWPYKTMAVCLKKIESSTAVFPPLHAEYPSIVYIKRLHCTAHSAHGVRNAP